ncbi:hypothetical protein A3Q56_06076 [Intoshia linei]|uniref:Uncharacterized protein n=1 Tax=Intoshia linei TaxID=1819745 RepID=A0A177AYE2_9BILA|nr:hypothetical protein A3Q56_06076 [Intoshia linei]
MELQLNQEAVRNWRVAVPWCPGNRVGRCSVVPVSCYSVVVAYFIILD